MRPMRIGVMVIGVLMLMGADGPSNGGDMVGLLREFGFPILVSLWFMWRVEKRMERFTDAIQNLLTAITVMAKTVDNLSNGRAQINGEHTDVRPRVVTP